MDTKSFLTISQLSHELDSGEAIVKFITKRFKKWIPGTEQTGQKYYNQKSLVTMIFLFNKICMGVLPSVIEEELERGSSQAVISDDNPSFNKKIDLLERKIKALEKRTQAEETTALAIKKITETEALKIETMNNIVNAITEMKNFISKDFDTDKIFKTFENIDLSQLADTKKIITDKQIDDLSILIDKKGKEESGTENNKQEKIDDLSSLLDNKPSNTTKIDDLSTLIVEPESEGSEEPEIDDLSILVTEPKSKKESVDDLSSLIDFKSKTKPKIKKREFSPKDDFEKYKSEIINIIIDLKNQGSTEEETCEQFNQEGILTFSGKAKWSVKIISQIYKLIENAA